MKSGFYVTGRHPDAGWVATLLGPYADKDTAAGDVEQARTATTALHPPAAEWTYGVEPAAAAPGAELLTAALEGTKIHREVP